MYRKRHRFMRLTFCKMATVVASVAMCGSLALAKTAFAESVTEGSMKDVQTAQWQLPDNVRPVVGNEDYTIYPHVHDVHYATGEVMLPSQAAFYYDNTLDSYTKQYAHEVFGLRSVELQDQQSAPTINDTPGHLNVLVGSEDSQGPVKAFVEKLKADNRISYKDNLFNETDAYVLAVLPGGKNHADTIAILGKNTDSAYYGLSTVRQIFQQINGRTVKSLVIADWADIITRGFIEGYYGNPWSVQDRVNLMKWGGNYKLNAYIYAPKDDAHHRDNWRALYTQHEMETQIIPEARAGNESKVKFVYALAPFFKRTFRFDSHYNEDLKVLEARYLQVINAGVREIALLADDAPNRGNNNYLRLLNDLTAWLRTLQAMKNPDGTAKYEGLKDTIPYCPAMYTYAGYGEGWYSSMPKNVQIIMTGGRVFGPVNQAFSDTFSRNTHGLAPFMWINWPVTDPTNPTPWNNLAMGGQNAFLESGLRPHSVSGVVLNPMQQSEPSKQAIFTMADYTWKIWKSPEEGKRAWQDSFSHIEHSSPIATSASDGLRALAMNMRVLYDNGITIRGGRVDPKVYDRANKWFTDDESVDYSGRNDVYGILSAIKRKLDTSQVSYDDLRLLTLEYNGFLQSALAYEQGAVDKALYAQMQPFVETYKDLSRSVIAYAEAARQAKIGDAAKARTALAEGLKYYNQSKTHKIDYLGKKKITRVGLRIVEPTENSLKTYAEHAVASIGSNLQNLPTVTLNDKLFTGYGRKGSEADPRSVVDGKDSTYYWMSSNKAATDKGASITVTYPQARSVRDFRMLQADDIAPHSGDAITNGKFEYQSPDGEWHLVGNITSGKGLWEFHKVSPVVVKAIRVTNLKQTAKWWKLFDLSTVPVPGNLQGVSGVVAKARALNTDHWTYVAKSQLLEDINRAANLGTSSGQQEIDAAVAALKQAMTPQLQYAAKSAEQLKSEFVSDGDDVTSVQGSYTPMSYEQYRRAYDHAYFVLTHLELFAPQKAKEAVDAVTSAKNALIVNQTARDEALAYARQMPAADASKYTKQSYDAYAAAAQALVKLLSDDERGSQAPSAYTAAVEKVKSAFKALAIATKQPDQMQPGKSQPEKTQPTTPKPADKGDKGMVNTGAVSGDKGSAEKVPVRKNMQNDPQAGSLHETLASTGSSVMPVLMAVMGLLVLAGAASLGVFFKKRA